MMIIINVIFKFTGYLAEWSEVVCFIMKACSLNKISFASVFDESHNL